MMILIIDANILIAELLRQRGRELLRNPQLMIYAADKVIEESNYEIQKRIRHMVTSELANILSDLECFGIRCDRINIHLQASCNTH